MSDFTERLSAALADRYRIERELGAGGMATVYLAEDLKHNRQVAIKVLKPELAAVLGADRFVQEIKTTAALQHPHILPLFDSGEADGFLFYVMPYVEGETLRDKLNRETQLGIDEAVKIVVDVADALQYAHDHGVIHRDIKPENILLHAGRPMVADFGIALALSAAAGGRMTETGMSLGTPHYMSPEQATADKDITGRSDIYSLASVLYEMLTGNPPHVGSSAQQIFARIITDDARPVRELRKSVPANVAAALAQALEKLPADRFESANAFADALNNPAFTRTGEDRATSSARTDRYKRAFLATSAGLVFALIALIALVATRRGGASGPEFPVVRVPLHLPSGAQLATYSGSFVVAPQGDRILYSVESGANVGRTFVWNSSELGAQALAPEALRDLTYSPDGRWVAYSDGDHLFTMRADGGQRRTIATMPHRAFDDRRGLAWTPSDSIIISSSDGLWIVPAIGGTPQPLFAADSGRWAVWPMVLPGGQAVAYAVGREFPDDRIAIGTLRTRQRTVLDVVGASVLGLQEGRLVYVTQDGTLMAVPFDLDHLRVTGDSVPLDHDIMMGPFSGAVASLSHNGTLAYAKGSETTQLVLASEGDTDVAIPVSGNHSYGSPAFSPDGRRIAFTMTSAGGAGSDIWVWSRTARTLTRITVGGTNALPAWTPDGSGVVFVSHRGGTFGIWWERSDGSDTAEALVAIDTDLFYPEVSPDGKWLVYVQRRDGGIRALSLAGRKRPVTVVPADESPSMPRISPNGKWLAYQSALSGTPEVYVRPFPAGGERVTVSNQGGTEPVWTKSGRALIYRTDVSFVSVDIRTGSTFTMGARRALRFANFPMYRSNQPGPDYDASRDGGPFVMVKKVPGGTPPVVVFNWNRELREKLSVGLQKKMTP